MIARLGCACQEAFLGDDSIAPPDITDTSGDAGGVDLSSMDFGAEPQPILSSPVLSFPDSSIDPTTGIPYSEETPGGIGLLPTTLPPSDLSAASTTLSPGTYVGSVNGSSVYQNASGQLVDLNGNAIDPATGVSYASELSGIVPTTVGSPSSSTSSGSTAATIAASAAGAGSLATILAKVFGATGATPTQTTAPAGYTYNSAGQLVPITTASTGLTGALSSAGAWLSGSTLVAGLPNWALIGGGVLGVVLLSSLGGKKRR